jgi:hypothetical protein
MTALAPSYDFFMYYFTLVITPMVLLCGVFFPIAQLPPLFQYVAAVLPLTHAIGPRATADERPHSQRLVAARGRARRLCCRRVLCFAGIDPTASAVVKAGQTSLRRA